jgi:hypothetical protein
MLISTVRPGDPYEAEVLNLTASDEFQKLLAVLRVINLQQATADRYCGALAHSTRPVAW